MRLAVVVASTRANSESRRLADYFVGRLEQKSLSAPIVDLHELGLPLFGTVNLDQATSARLETTQAILLAASGIVLVVPEWNGAAAPGWNNLVLFVGDSLAHKPLLAVGVSAGRGGAYPLLGVRSSGYKNSRYVVIPESLIISNCGQFLAGGPNTPEAESLIKRTDYALAVLVEYATALESVRRSGVIDHKTHPSGV